MTPRTTTRFLGLGAALALAACATGFTSPATLNYHPSTGVDLDAMELRESGLYVETISEGWGDEAAENGDRVKIHYVGLFPDGRKFDSSLDAGETMDFRVGFGEVIEAWEEGVVGMKVGGRRRLVVPPELGYPTGLGDALPPDQVLVFEIQLVELN